MLLPLIQKKINIARHLGFATLVVGDGQKGGGGFFVLLAHRWPRKVLCFGFQFGDSLSDPPPPSPGSQTLPCIFERSCVDERVSDPPPAVGELSWGWCRILDPGEPLDQR